MNDLMKTSWWFGVGPMDSISSAISEIVNFGWQIQVINSIGKYEKFSEAALIVARRKCKVGEKAPFPHPGNDWHPVWDAQE